MSIPGPQVYTVPSTLNNSVRESPRISKKYVFGNSVRNLFNKFDKIPGPGSYQYQNLFKLKKRSPSFTIPQVFF